MPEHLITELSMQDFFKAYKSFKEMLPKQISTVLPDEEVVNNYEYKNVETIENVFIEVQGPIKGRALFRLVILSLLSLQNNKQLTVSDVARSLRFNPEFFGLTSEDVKVVIALIEGDKNRVQSGHIQQHMFERLAREILKMK
jgi:Na+/H+ antiporter NhaB